MLRSGAEADPTTIVKPVSDRDPLMEVEFVITADPLPGKERNGKEKKRKPKYENFLFLFLFLFLGVFCFFSSSLFSCLCKKSYIVMKRLNKEAQW